MGAVGSVDNRLRLSKEGGQPLAVTRSAEWVVHAPALSTALLCLAKEKSIVDEMIELLQIVKL
jgi:hypothetical protein